jgi:hypothetical protein
MSNVQAVTALTISGSLTFGMVLALLGYLKLTLARHPQQATRRIDLLLSLLNLALIPLTIAAGVLVDFWGVRHTIITGSILLSLAFLALSAGAAYRRTLVYVAVAAFGASAVGTASLVLMPQGLFGTHETTASLQLGLVLVALGALLMQPLLDILVRSVGFRLTMLFVALVSLAPAFLAALPDRGTFPARGTIDALSGLLQDGGVWMAGLVFFCYAPLEAFVSVWTTNYLSNTGQSQRQVRWLAGFWCAFLLSRLLVAFIEHAGYLRDDWSGWFLFASAMLSTVTLGNMAGAIRPAHGGKGLILLGFFLGPLFPLLAGMLFRMSQTQDLTGTAFGVLQACGILGSLALAPLVRVSARARTIQGALVIPLVIAGVLTAAILLFGLAQTITEPRA